MFSNFNCDYETVEYDYPTQLRTGLSIKMLDQNCNLNTWRFLEITDGAYTIAFSENHKIESFVDGCQRVKQFLIMAEKTIIPLEDLDLDGVARRITLGLMLLRAAYGSDPVSWLQNSQNKIDYLRYGVQHYNLTTPTISTLSAVLIHLIVGKSDIDKMPRVMYSALRCELEVRNISKQWKAYDTFLEKLEALAKFDWITEEWK